MIFFLPAIGVSGPRTIYQLEVIEKQINNPKLAVSIKTMLLEPEEQQVANFLVLRLASASWSWSRRLCVWLSVAAPAAALGPSPPGHTLTMPWSVSRGDISTQPLVSLVMS